MPRHEIERGKTILSESHEWATNERVHDEEKIIEKMCCVEYEETATRNKATEEKAMSEPVNDAKASETGDDGPEEERKAKKRRK